MNINATCGDKYEPAGALIKHMSEQPSGDLKARHCTKGGPISATVFELYLLIDGSYVLYLTSMGGASLYECSKEEANMFISRFGDKNETHRL